MKRLVSTKVRENLSETRNARKAAKEEAIAQTRARNRIEKEKFMDELNQRNRAAFTKNAKHIKHQIIMKHQKFERDRKTGLHVASVSRLISQMFDRQKHIETKIRELNKLQETAGAIKSKNMENRLAMREQLVEIEEQKRRLTLIDRLLTENKRQIRDQHQAEFIQHLQEEKRKNIKRDGSSPSRGSHCRSVIDSTPTPNSFDSTESMTYRGSSFSANISSSDAFRRMRGPRLSAGMDTH